MEKGTFYIVSAPSGCGKSSIVNALVSSVENLVVSISYTTRPIRKGEIDKRHYYFVDEQEFELLKHSKAFIECAKVFGYWYATSKFVLDEYLDKGLDVILDIDWQGANQIKETGLDCVSVYLMPPSREELVSRLQSRGRDPESVIKQRMQEVSQQVSNCSIFDYIIVNDDFEQAVDDFRSIIRVNRLANRYQQIKYKNIIQSLLAD